MSFGRDPRIDQRAVVRQERLQAEAARRQLAHEARDTDPDRRPPALRRLVERLLRRDHGERVERRGPRTRYR